MKKPLLIVRDTNGAVLLQGDNITQELDSVSYVESRYHRFRDKLRLIAFSSKPLSDTERRYSAMERVIGGSLVCREFLSYTFANKIHIISDNKSFHTLFSDKLLISHSPRIDILIENSS